MRLFQIIDRGSFRGDADQRTQVRIRRCVRESPKFVVDNVAAYWRDIGQTQVEKRGLWRECPNVAPPFETFWMEAIADGRLVGALFESRKTETGWDMQCTPFQRFARDEVLGPVVIGRVLVDEHGRVTDQRAAILRNDQGKSLLEESVRGTDIPASAALGMMAPFFLALSFLHCSNVTTHDEVATQGARRYRRARDPKQFLTYKTLHIEPMTRALNDAGAATDIRQALHVCRGHFKDYREHGLFGRTKGLFWWDSHVRGDKARGGVVTDYTVSPPKTDDDPQPR